MKNANTLIAATAISLFLSGYSAHATSSTWNGGSTANGDWSTAGNWAGSTVPGSTSGVSTDTATFNSAIANTWGNSAANPVVIDSTTQNIGSIAFTLLANGYFIGSTAGNSLFLDNGGSISMGTLSSGGSQTYTDTVNAPLVIVGAGATYSFTNNSTSNTTNPGSGVLAINGAISGGTAGNTVLTLNGTNTLTTNVVTGAISNGSATTFALVKSGAGRWTLSGTSSYTGGTTISNGVLYEANSSALGSGTVLLGDTAGANNATLSASSASATSIANNITVQGTGSTVDSLGNTAAGTVSFTGTLTLGSSSAAVHGLTLSPNANENLTVSGNIVDPSGVTTGGGALTINGGNVLADIRLTGTGNTFTGGVNVTGGTLVLGNATAAGGGTITLSAGTGIGVVSAGALAINNLVTVNGNFSIGNTGTPGGTLTLSNNVTLGASSTITDSNAALVVNGVISDGGSGFSLTTADAIQGGTITLGGLNTFSGGFTLNGSAGNQLLRITNLGTVGAATPASALGTGTFTIGSTTGGTDEYDNFSSAAGVLSTNNAQVWNGDFTFVGTKSLDMGTGAISLGTTNAATRTVTVSANNLAEGGVIANGTGTTTPTVNLTKAGSGTLSLYGANTYTGVTTISAGTLSIGNGGTTGSLASSGVTDNATLAFNRSDSALNFVTTISGTGGVNQIGSGLVTLSGANTFTGVTTVTAGTLAITTIQNLSSTTANSLGEPTTATNGTIGIVNGATLQYVGSTAGSSNRVINMNTTTGGTFNLDASGSATFALSGGVTTSGTGTTTSTLGLTGTGAGSESGSIVNGASSNLTAVQKSGTGTWTLSGANTYTGGTKFNGGDLAVGSTGALGSAGALSFAGGTLQYTTGITTDYSARFSSAGSQSFSVDTNGVAVTYGTAITGAGSTFTLSDSAGTGTLTFTAGNTYSGLTSVNSGELDLNRTAGVSVAGPLTVGDGVGSANTATVKLLASGQLGSGSAVIVNKDGDLDLHSSLAQIASLTSNSGDIASSASGGVLTVTGATSFTGTGNIIASGGTVTNGATATLANGGSLAVNGTLTNGLSAGTGATVSGTGHVGALSLAGTDTVTSSTTLNTAGITVSGTGNTISAGTVTGNVIFSGASGTPAALDVEGAASGTVNVSAYSTLSGLGTTGAVTLGGTSSGINLVKSNSTTGTLTVGGLTTTGGGTLTFAIGTSSGAIDNIADTGTLVLGGSTSIVITNLNNTVDGSQTLVAGGGTTYLLMSTTGISGGGTLTLSTATLDGESLSLNLIGNNYYLTVGGGVTDTGTDYFNGSSSDLTKAASYDTGLSTGTATPAAPSASSNLFFSSSANSSVTSGTANSNMEVNSINFGVGGTKTSFAVSGTGTITIDATSANSNTAGSGITIAAGGGSASIGNAIALGADQSFAPSDASSVLTVSGTVSGAHKLTKSGAGTVVLSASGGNSYSGGTAVTAGLLLVTNTTGSGTGSGVVSVTGSTAILGGSGKISGAVTLSSGGNLYSGATASSVTTGPGTGAVNGTSGGMTLNSTLAVNGAALTFALTGSGTGTLSGPLESTSYLHANGVVSFSGSDTINLVDETTGGLSLRIGSTYLLISSSLGDAGFSGLVTQSANGTIGLDGDGYVLGAYTGGTTGSYTWSQISFNQYGADGVTPLTSSETAAGLQLYLNAGDLEVVPEPSTWALMLGGLALLVVIQRRRASKLS